MLAEVSLPPLLLLLLLRLFDFLAETVAEAGDVTLVAMCHSFGRLNPKAVLETRWETWRSDPRAREKKKGVESSSWMCS